MINTLFLVFHGFDSSNGISKKIFHQVEALRSHNMNVRLCYLDETTGNKLRMVDSQVICDYGDGVKGKILKRIEFNSIVRYAKREKIEFIYMRSDLNANPWTIQLVKKLRKLNIRIAMEIPTYPYDKEKDSIARVPQRILDRIFRTKLAKYIDRIVTFSNDKTIFGVSTIQISNGIDFNSIKIRQNIVSTHNKTNELHLIGVAQIHYWHGFDRLLKGLANYYKTNSEFKVYFHIVGSFFSERERNEILIPIKENKLEPYVTLYGERNREKLDMVFEKADMAVGSLGRHRSGIVHIKTLKNREYAARGFSFMYSETDDDFEQMPYILKIPANESDIDVNNVIAFHNKLNTSPEDIRSSISDLSWKNQMRKVVKEMGIENK